MIISTWYQAIYKTSASKTFSFKNKHIFNTNKEVDDAPI